MAGGDPPPERIERAGDHNRFRTRENQNKRLWSPVSLDPSARSAAMRSSLCDLCYSAPSAIFLV